MSSPPWGTVAVRQAFEEVVLLSDSKGAVYAKVSPDGSALGGSAISKLTENYEACLKTGAIKMPKTQDLKSLLDKGEPTPYVVDPYTGAVRAMGAMDNELTSKKQFGKLFSQVENVLTSSANAASSAITLPGQAHPGGGYLSRSGQWYPPAGGRVKQIQDEVGGRPGSNIEWKHSSFSWRTLYHPFVMDTINNPAGLKDVKHMAETVMSPTPLRMYTDHRVMMQIVLPGVSHISLAAATASLAVEGKNRMGRNDFVIHVGDVMFERPYMVHDGKNEIAAVQEQGLEKAGPLLGPMTYCTCEKGVEKEYVSAITDKNLKLDLEWAPDKI